ncbi:MAG TPA: alpha/beta hydrolase [Patescibacteria group bacterium]|nr:alpha/beta hydrolase [Patescibacteria group bacterium]
MPKVRVGDIEIYYESKGEGEPLLLIMGLGSDLTGWMLQVLEFYKSHRVVSFDNRGAGRTDAPGTPYSIGMMADDSAGLMDALDIGSAHVLGISMGGFIAQELALRHPGRVRSLILAATGTRIDARGAYQLDVWRRLIDTGDDRELYIRETLPWLFTEGMFGNHRAVESMIKMRLSYPYPQPAYAYARQADACLAFDSRERLASITAPTLVVAGERDCLFPPGRSGELAAGIRNAELVVLEGGAHGFPIEFPDLFNRTVLSFLERHAGDERRLRPPEGVNRTGE